MTLTKKMDWPALLAEARRQWDAGNAEGVRWFYSRKREAMPEEFKAMFADLLASNDVRKRGRKPKSPEVTAVITLDGDETRAEIKFPIARQFIIPEVVSVAEHVTKLRNMGREIAVVELVADLKRAKKEGDMETLRQHGLEKVSDKHFKRLALEAARRRVFLKSQAE